MRIKTAPRPVALLALAALGVAACNGANPGLQQAPDPQDQAPFNRAMVQWLNNAAIDNAILTQRTLFPYHFVAHSPELNDLGRRDLAVLANHYRRHPGTINVRRADTPDDLFDARVAAIYRQIAELGVATTRIEIADRVPNGDGLASDHVMVIREASAARTAAAPATN